MIVGDIGYRDHMVFTALGDAVNVAARLQDMTKTLACEAIVSEEVRITAGLAADALAAAGSRDPRPRRADDRAHRRGCEDSCRRWSTTSEVPPPEALFLPPLLQKTPVATQWPGSPLLHRNAYECCESIN